jgi:hypothetical protein
MSQYDPTALEALGKLSRLGAVAVLLVAGHGWYKGNIEWRHLLFAVVACAATSWAHIATYYVPEPYLVRLKKLSYTQVTNETRTRYSTFLRRGGTAKGNGLNGTTRSLHHLGCE